MRAENAVALSWVSINNAMGLDSTVQYALSDTLDYAPFEITRQKALDTAYANRPDLKAYAARKDEAGQQISLAKKEYYPVLSALGSYKFEGDKSPLDSGWVAGVGMSVNLFNGFATARKIDEASARLQAVGSQEKVLRLDIQKQVENACLNLQLAEKSIADSRVEMRLAAENLDIANYRYEAGLGDAVEIADAMVSMSRAGLTNVVALYDYKTAQALLELAMAMR